MTQRIESILEIASKYEVLVFDQWGVLHNGSTPYPSAVEALQELSHRGQKLAVLSNSGKRAEPNAKRIAGMGFEDVSFDRVMTSGEALWRDIQSSPAGEKSFFAIERAKGDAATWAQGLDIKLCDNLQAADAVLLMGLPDGATVDDWRETLDRARQAGLPIYCSNPDRKSPRSGGFVVSPGALAFAYQDAGGEVTFYGKPHLPVFQAIEKAMGTGRYLMVGDSMEHDIAGAQTAGWDSLLIEGGLYADQFGLGDDEALLVDLAQRYGCATPTYRLSELK